MSVGVRNPRIDLIRGVAIILVLFHHFNIAYRLDAWVFGWDAVRAVARNGNYGVTMFFVVSGYLITSNADRRWSGLSRIDARAFYGLRVARIVPCLVLLLAVVNLLAAGGVAIFQNHAPVGVAVSFWMVNLASLTLWMNVLIGACGWVNYPLGVLWSLSIEEVFYIAFPILCLMLRRESRLLVFWAAIIVVGPVYRFFHRGDEAGLLYAYFACFDGIAIGCCSAVLAKRTPVRGVWGMIVQGLAVAGMTFLYLWGPIGQSAVVGVTAMAMGTAVLLLGAHHRADGPVPGGTWVLVWLGQLNYELYLFHLIVLGVIRTLFPPAAVVGGEKLALLVAFFVLSAMLAAGISRCFAEPLNRGIRRRLAVRGDAVASS
ncbi:MAG TPA: acyltransferase [Rhodopila sp.]|jgi:peptidoglycan/LPS O-acetylase OafA/YrhL